jgi:hypothetical protein
LSHDQHQFRRQIFRLLNLVAHLNPKIQKHIIHTKLLKAVNFLLVFYQELHRRLDLC